MTDQTIEKQIEERIFNKLEAKLQEVKIDTKKQISHLQVDTTAKIKRLSTPDTSVAWKYFRSDAAVTNSPSKDDPSIFQLSQDLYSILATASWRSSPYWISMFMIFGFQFSLLILLLANQLDVNSDNPLNLPANVETPVRISQALLIVIALFSQDDLLVGIESLVDGFPDLFRGDVRFSNVTRLQWRLSSILRLSQGLLNLFAAFVLSIQSETVPDVLLNVLGVGFVSNLDNQAFQLSMKGYFGGAMKQISEDLCNVQFHRTTNSQNARSVVPAKIKKDAHIIIAFAFLLLGIVMFSIFAVQQHIGMYSEQDIRIEFGDEVLPFLGLFNGCYQASDSSENIGRLVYEQVGYPNGGKFGFCSDFGEGESGWAFFIGGQEDNICENYVVRSGDTSTFSLLEAGKTNWYTSDDLPLDSLEITEIKTSSSDCGQSMFKSFIHVCPVLASDSMTMARLPVKVDVNSDISVDASVSHAIYYNEDAGQVGSFTLIFFSGRRWIRTTSDHIRLLGNETTRSDIEDFFDNDGLFTLVDHLRASTDSQPMQWVDAISESVNTARDQGSPLGLQWYFPRYEEVDDTAENRNLQRNFPSADLARPIDSSLTCLYCNEERNPCLHEGVCDNDNGICDCKHGASGRLCQAPPLGDGICNLYFNRAEYNYDGGDCCAGTCNGGTCGEDDLPDPLSAFVLSNRGWNRLDHYFVHTEEWKETFRGRKFAYDVDIVTDYLQYDGLLPLRYSHCKDPDTALLIIEQEGYDVGVPKIKQAGSSVRVGTKSFSGTSVQCNGTLYLRTPPFDAETELMNRTFAEKIRVPYGVDCVVTIDKSTWGGSSWDGHEVKVSLFAENQSVPFRRLDVSCAQRTVRLRIPDSDCVWNTFVENLVSVFSDAPDHKILPFPVLLPRQSLCLDIFTDVQDDSGLHWNDYLSEEEYTNFTKGVQLGSICRKDPDEMLERYALWTISKLSPVDLSQNFVGHTCDALWSEGHYMHVVCSGRRVIELTVRNSDHLPSEIGRLSLLKVLELDGNQWTSLPSEIGRLASLSALGLDNNAFTTLPSEIGQLTSLEELALHSNNLTSLPSEIGRLTLLKDLVLHVNNLTSLPSEIGELASLMALGLNYNQLTSLPSEIGRLTSLIGLGLSDNQLTSLPSEIGRLTLLENPLLYFNKLTSLPSEIGRLTALSVLDLNDNNLTSLPSEIGQLTLLQELGLSVNNLTLLPSAVGSLTLLTKLDLGLNHLASLSSEIGSLKSLTYLDLVDNQLASLPSKIGRLTSMTALLVSDNQLTSVESEIGRLVSLEALLLSKNQLASLPSEIGGLTSLTLLTVGENQLASLPSEIGGLTSLTLLTVGENQLASLPSEIGQLTSLENLDLSNNQLVSIPSEITSLSWLQELSLQRNQLTSLPTEIGSLPSLEALWLQRNRLTSLPTEIGSLPLLKALFLHRNQLTSLPSEIGNLSSLMLLNLFFNPLTANSLPTEISKLTRLQALYVCGDDGGYGCGMSDDNSCTDSVGWLDINGDGCELYEAYVFSCGDGFADRYQNADGISGNDACCVCDGGTRTNGGR